MFERRMVGKKKKEGEKKEIIVRWDTVLTQSTTNNSYSASHT